MSAKIVFFQMFEHESSTYTYVIGDLASREAAIVDSVLETVERDVKLIEDLDLKLKFAIDTHVHADHITASGFLRNKMGAKIAISKAANVSAADIHLQDKEELFLGGNKIMAIATPGHTDSCMSYLFADMLFTGDTLLIRGTGRTDFQQGSAEKLFDSIREKIFTLPDHIKIYPGHDYKGHTASTVGLEKKFNPRINLSRSKADFIKIMAELKLAQPKKIAEAVPLNLLCGEKHKS